MTKRRDLNKALKGKTVKKVQRDMAGSLCWKIVFTDGTTILVREDGLFDQDGNYFDTSKVK